jgi:penicillin-binding protein 1C
MPAKRKRNMFFKSKVRIAVAITMVAAIGVVAVLSYRTGKDMLPLPDSFDEILYVDYGLQVLDRNNVPLNKTYKGRWNTHDYVKLHNIPEFMRQAFIISEDKRFYEHSGQDWKAKANALVQNIKSMKAVRGASTISEQVVRMIHPRPRTIWSKWLEGWEAENLEQQFNKHQILEFYLNQIPYASNRRGIAQAARYYFNRDLQTLSKKEMLALIVLVRSPSRMDLFNARGLKQAEKSVLRLAETLEVTGVISAEEKQAIKDEQLNLQKPSLSISAPHFVSYVKQNHENINSLSEQTELRTTIDARLQQQVQDLLNRRIRRMSVKNVKHGAVLVADHTSGEILAWAVAGDYDKNTEGSFINAVTTYRQPGSAIKPFVYAEALEKGWTAATIIDDSPLTERVNGGLHAYRNYSLTFYGDVTLRNALGNSLNIPAVKTLQFVGAENHLNTMHKLGFSLNYHPNFYGDGMALGNGEVTLLEMVQAYTTLANKGIFRPLYYAYDNFKHPPIHAENENSRIYSEEVTSIIGNILSDDNARTLEFGGGMASSLHYDVQTAVKTGTSNDYRDAWTIGYNYKYVVGSWMGNLDRKPMKEVTGSIGPAPLVKSVFSALNKNAETKPLFLSPKLISADVCLDKKQQQNNNDHNCQTYSEWFIKGTEPSKIADKTHLANINTKASEKIILHRPTNGLQIAYDPRLLPEEQAFEFMLKGVTDNDAIEWNIDGKHIKSKGKHYLWAVSRGTHTVSATVYRQSAPEHPYQTKTIEFLVK